MPPVAGWTRVLDPHRRAQGCGAQLRIARVGRMPGRDPGRGQWRTGAVHAHIGPSCRGVGAGFSQRLPSSGTLPKGGFLSRLRPIGLVSGSSASRNHPAVRAVHLVRKCDGLRNPAQVSIDVQLRRNVLFGSVLLLFIMLSLFGIHFLFAPAYNEPVFVAEF